MSKIIANNNLKTKSWEVTFENLAPTYADLYIGFTNHTTMVGFKNLKFKYELKQNGTVEKSNNFPPPNTYYVKSDQSYLVVEQLGLTSETDYELYLWAENNSLLIEKTVYFTTPRPAQIFPSWTWENKQWNPPTEYPNDGKLYQWNENTLSWEEHIS